MFCPRILRIIHFVILMKGGHVPRNIDRHSGDELGQSVKFIV